MDKKTLEALALVHTLIEPISAIVESCDYALDHFSRYGADPPNPVALSLRFEVAPLRLTLAPLQDILVHGADLNILAFTSDEIALLFPFLKAYRDRLSGILDGCAVKLSPDVRSLLADLEKNRQAMRDKINSLRSAGRPSAPRLPDISPVDERRRS